MENIYKKIKTIDELKPIFALLKKQGKKIAHCHGVFDLIHPGHIRHLAAAKKEGDVLLVSVTADQYVRKGPGRPVFNENLRAETLAAMENVDYVLINHAPISVNIIKELKPDVYVKGQDYQDKKSDLTGKIADEEAAIRSVGGKIVFTQDITFSSSKLLNEHLDVFPKETREYLKKLSSKHDIDDIVGYFKKAEGLKVLVIGDAILDQYHYCQSMGMSLKGQIVVTKYLSDESFAGGVFATANNTASICKKTSLVTVVGDDNPYKDFIAEHLDGSISAKYFVRKGAPTTIKRRFVSENRKMFEICYMNDEPVSKALEKQIIDHLKKTISSYDLVIVSDFGHGFFTKAVVDLISRKAKYLALNVQTNSANMGFNFLSKWPKADYVSIDEPEIRLAAHEKHHDLKAVMLGIMKSGRYRNLIVTKGPRGSVFYSKNTGFLEAPALASRVIDSVGAGDALFAYTAPVMAVGCPSDLTSFIGNAVGALAVQIICNREAVNQVDLLKFVNRLMK